MEIEAPSFASLLLVVGLGFCAPLAAHFLRKTLLPVVVLEIAAGALFGRSGFGLIHEDAYLSFLSHFGFAYLMFLSGLEMDVQVLLPERDEGRRLRSSPLGAAFFRFATLFVLSLGFAVLLVRFDLVEDAIFVALLLCNSSVGIVMSVLKENGISAAPEGQSALVSTLAADFLSVLGLSAYVAFRSHGLEWRLFLVLLLLLSGAVIYRIVLFGRGRASWFDAAFSSMAHGTAQLQLRAIFAMIFLLIVEAEALGTEVILGAFVAGVTISFLIGRESEELREKLDVIGYGLLVPVFFVMVGSRLDLSVLLRDPRALPLVGLLLAGAIAGGAAVSLLAARRFGRKKALAFEMLLLSRLSLAIAGASVGVKAGIVSTETETAVVLFAVASCILGPVLFRRLHHPDRGRDMRETNPWIVVGTGRGGLRLADHLLASGISVLFLTDRASLEMLPHSPALPIRCCRCLDDDCLVEAGVLSAPGLVLEIGNDRRTLELARSLRQRHGVERILAVVPDDMAALLLREIGVRAFSSEEAEQFAIEQCIRVPALFDALTGEQGGEIFELRVNAGFLAGKTLAELAHVLPPEARVLLVTRGREALLPRGGTYILEGDVLTLMGDRRAMETVRPLCGSGNVCELSLPSER